MQFAEAISKVKALPQALTPTRPGSDNVRPWRVGTNFQGDGG